MAHSEKGETPEMEAKEHSPAFLKRAAKKSKKGRGKKRGGKKRRGGRGKGRKEFREATR